MNGAGTIIWIRFVPALLVFAASCGFLVWANTYDDLEGLVPRLVAWLAIALSAIDLVASTRSAVGHRLASVLSGVEIDDADVRPAESGRWRREAIAMAWIAAFVACVALLGFYIVLPPFIALFMVVQGGRSWRSSLISAAVTSFIIYLVFEVLWSYSIYKGWFFEQF